MEKSADSGRVRVKSRLSVNGIETGGDRVLVAGLVGALMGLCSSIVIDDSPVVDGALGATLLALAAPLTTGAMDVAS